MNPGYLVLYPEADGQTVQPEPLLETLRRLGLAGEQVGNAPERYRTGSAYLNLITYLGCSPSIPLADGPQDSYCQLRLAGPYPVPVLLSGGNTRPPRCPHCNHPFADWKGWLDDNGEQPGTCGQCAGTLQLADLRWREQAALARLFVLISHVFPGEAVPVERLMANLRREGGDWHHAYVQKPCIWRPDKGWVMLGED